jgi:hypothetical protein
MVKTLYGKHEENHPTETFALRPRGTDPFHPRALREPGGEGRPSTLVHPADGIAPQERLEPGLNEGASEGTNYRTIDRVLPKLEPKVALMRLFDPDEVPFVLVDPTQIERLCKLRTPPTTRAPQRRQDRGGFWTVSSSPSPAAWEGCPLPPLRDLLGGEHNKPRSDQPQSRVARSEMGDQRPGLRRPSDLRSGVLGPKMARDDERSGSQLRHQAQHQKPGEDKGLGGGGDPSRSSLSEGERRHIRGAYYYLAVRSR